MKVKFPFRFTLALLAALVLLTPATLRAQDARGALTNFPESQAVMYVNARRLMNEAVPSVVPPEVFNKALADAKQFIDLQGLEYMIAGVRLKGEVSAKNLPEFLLIVRGNFSADALLSGARMMGQDMYAQESHGGKTLNVFTLNKPAPPAAADSSGAGNKGGSKFPVDQIAATALDANTLAIGIPSYLRDAIDASAGGGTGARLKPELIDLALRDENTLISIVTDVPPASSKHLRALGAPPNAEADRIIDALRQVQLSVNMLPGTFGVQSIMRLDSAEAAATLSGLVTMGANVAKGEIAKDVQKKIGSDREDTAALLRVLETLTNAARDNEVAIGLTFQQASLAEVIKRQLAPKPPKPAALAPPAKKAPPRRTGRAPRKR